MRADKDRTCASFSFRLLSLLGVLLNLTLASSASAQAMQPGAGMGMPAGGPKPAKKAPPKVIVGRNVGFDSFNIVAVVDNEVILLEDILVSIRSRLEAAKKQLPPNQYKAFERKEIEAATRARIQQKIVLHELHKKIPSDSPAMDRIARAADGDFERWMMKVAHENNLDSREAIMAKLKEEGADVNKLRKDFIDNLVAQQFLFSMIMPRVREPSRQEMEDFYSTHPERFSQPAGVVWRHIEIKKGIDIEAARAKINQIGQALAGGADFAQSAKAQSQGPTAVAGGLWSRTSKGSYADPAVDKVLFSQPIGQVSGVIDGKLSFHLILVEERSNGEPKPFTEVQEQIREMIKSEQRESLRKEVVSDLSASHHVVTAFDKPEEATAINTESADNIR